VEAAVADYQKAVSEQQRALGQLLALSQGNTNAVDSIYRLRAPISGMVVDKNLTLGQQIRPDLMLANAQQFVNPLFVVTDPHKLWLFLDVTELDAVTLKPGQEIRVHTKAYPDRVFVGRLERIGEALDPSTRTIKARVVLDNPDSLLKAEMYITAEVMIDGVNGVDIPSKAVFLRDNQYCVFIEEAPGKFVRRAVKLGRENGGIINVISGLSVGQRVVTEGSLLLQEILKNGESL
jgi:cobalt-zinc-cadmium efflux system membrane fusion protein